MPNKKTQMTKKKQKTKKETTKLQNITNRMKLESKQQTKIIQSDTKGTTNTEQTLQITTSKQRK